MLTVPCTDPILSGPPPPRAAIVDYGMGNLFSVRQACLHVGLDAALTQSAREVEAADLVIIPGVGAFGEAMATLKRLDLIGAITSAAASGVPVVGICLGMQLLMDESDEFGVTRGLGLLPGRVERLRGRATRIKVPHLGWNTVHAAAEGATGRPRSWSGTPLEGTGEGAQFYFVHSYRVTAAADRHILSTTTYEGEPFCSSIGERNVFGCQFHPERSGPQGLRMYQRMVVWCRDWRTPVSAGSTGV